MRDLDVSVVVPVHDAMPYLVTCLASVMEQSLGRDRLEVVAVDDGSADGSGAQLDLLARSWPGLSVVHLEHSGGPSRPRNAGLDRVRGRYVFFLDADDYLGAEALERMLAVAQEHGSDVVACRRKQVGGRKGALGRDDHVPLAPKARHSGMEAAHGSAVATAAAGDWTALLVAGSDCKQLYRRDRIERLGLRFPEGVHFGEDSVFAADYLDGATAGMVGDYDCYYERLREDGKNLTTQLIGTEMHLDALERGMRRADSSQLRWRRDQLVRDAVLDVTQQTFNERFAGREVAVRRRLVERAQGLLERWLTPRTVARLPALDRVKVELIGRGMEAELYELAAAVAAGERGKDVVAGGRVYGGYPFLGDAAVGIADGCYEVTGELAVCHYLGALWWQGARLHLAGHAYIEHVDTVGVATEVVVREQRGGGEYRWPVRQVPVPGLGEVCGRGRYDYSGAGFVTVVDLADVGGGGGRLGPGQWGVFLAVAARGVCRPAPLGGNRAAGLVGPVDAQVSGLAGEPGTVCTVSAYFTKYGTLTIAIPAATAGVEPVPVPSPGPGGRL